MEEDRSVNNNNACVEGKAVFCSDEGLASFQTVRSVGQELFKSEYIWCLPGKRDATFKNTHDGKITRRPLARPDSFVQLCATKAKNRHRKRERYRETESPPKLNL